MSLKAKIEAVIYASEEPVTLAQLMGLLGHEAQEELDRAQEAQQTLALEAAETESQLQGEYESAAEPEEQAEAVVELAEPVLPAREAQSEPIETAVPDLASTESSDSQPAEVQGEGPAAEEQISAEAEAAALAKAEKARVAKLRVYFRSILDELVREYATGDRGLEIREVGGGFRLATKPEYHDAVRGFVKSLKPPLKLSLQALETLAVVAYKQPVTAPEVSEIRGVDSAGVLGSLISRKLVTTAGRKQVIGRPILYKTTKDFLLKFGLKDVSELPSIEEFEKMAGQLAEQEEIPMPEPKDQQEHHAPETVQELEQEGDSYAPQADGFSGAADNVSEETGDKASIDGRISSLPPNYEGEELHDNPSAQEAEIQRGE